MKLKNNIPTHYVVIAFLVVTLVGLLSMTNSNKVDSYAYDSDYLLSDNSFVFSNRTEKELYEISDVPQIFVDSPELPYPIEDPIDPTQSGSGSMNLENPPNIENEVVYDPVTGQYVVKQKNGSLDYRRPSGMTLEEYLKYLQDKEMSEFLQEKIEEENKEDKPTQLIPPIKIKGEGFRNVFGSDEINIRPTGAVEISLGVNSSRYDNPQIPVNQRRVTRFDFNQNIQINLVGEIGTKLKLTTSYNSQANFDFQNVTKLEYTGDEDQIIKKIELGNVAMDLPTSLIQGSQTLFGAKGKLQFGKVTVDMLASTHRGQKTEINIQGGAQEQVFEVKADNYEANRHYFLNFYHRDNYDQAMQTLPQVSSQVDITRIEVWVTNRINKTEGVRNIIAFADLGETDPNNVEGNPGSFNGSVPSNSGNGIYAWASNQPTIRAFNNATQTLSSQVTAPGPFDQAVHYEKVQNARMLTENEFTYNSKLGFISLNQPLNADEVLGVAYEYTYQGQTFQVGELSTDGVDGSDAIIVKMLKPTITTPVNKIWDLMMKNVYSIGAYNVGPQDFELNVWYNNPAQSTLIRYLPYENIDKKQLITHLGLDKLDQNGQPFSDGFFDFMPMAYSGNKASSGGTIVTRNGRVFFPTIEPFGATLGSSIESAFPPGSPETQYLIDRITFQELYDSTKTAAQQIPAKNRFYLKGKFTSSVSSDIPLNALNIPEGSVVVTAGGNRLVEGVDYQVDYNLGRVKILNTGLLESNTPIKISLESNSLFGFNQRTLLGSRINYRHSKDFNIGATWMNMIEKPITQKVNFGDEPFSNHIIGFDVNYRANVPWLTKFVDWLPVLSTRKKSTFTFRGEFAHLIPGTPRAIGTGGNSFIDDFEGSQSTIELKNFSAWRLASVPKGQPDLFPEASLINDRAAGYNRSKVAWYTVDPVFWGGTSGNNLTPDVFANNADLLENLNSTLFQQTDIFPQTQLQQGTINNIPILDVACYPDERGQYNYTTTGLNNDGTFSNPEGTWSGIMRSLTTTDFEQANVEYIQFWMMDPYNTDQQAAYPGTDGGKLYFNLGNVSEDILPDSRMSYENGLPPDGSNATDVSTTNWSKVSDLQPITIAFDNDPASRVNQDVGLDGYSDVEESLAYQDFVNAINASSLSPAAKAKILNDPSSDNYNYYLDDDFDAQGTAAGILERYKQYNGFEGNSATSEMSDTMNNDQYPTQARNAPDIEDLNSDQNLSETEAYFQYEVSLAQADLQVGQNFINSITTVDAPGGKQVRWIQFRIPIRKPQKVVNGLNDFRSIRFIRMFTRELEAPVVLRFAKLELIRGEWRRFVDDLYEPGDGIIVDPDLTTFNIGAVNLEENESKSPIPYKMPPDVVREQDGTAANFRQLNEQSLQLQVCGLQDGDARAGYRNIGMDVRSFKKIKMYVHGEYPDGEEQVDDDELTVFVRLGTDFTDNYYEYEQPLKITQPGTSSPTLIWPEANNMEIVLQDLLNAKKARNAEMDIPGSTLTFQQEFVMTDPNYSTKRIKVKGSPNLEDMKIVMIGVRNPRKNGNNPWKPDDGQPKCVEVWVNELRLSDFDTKGGSAATAQMSVNLADWANISMSGNYSGLNWGALDSRISDRQRDQRFSFDLISNFNMGQFFGKKAKIRMPLHVDYSLGVVKPEYDPYNPDVLMDDYDSAEKRRIQRIANDFTSRTSVNLINVGKDRKAGKKPHFWDLENLSLNFAYSEQHHRDFNTEYDNTKIYRGGINYAFNGKPKKWEPFKKFKKLQSPWLALIRDFNLYLGPKVMSITNDLNRSYSERKLRNTLNSDFEFEPTYLKNFTWNRQYQFKYDLTQNLKFDYQANNQSIFAEPEGQVDRKDNPDNYRIFEDSIYRQLRTAGKTMRYNHSTNISWNVPLDKLPITDWMNASVRYGSGYEWTRAPLNQPELGHTIQNNRTFSINGQMNFTKLYNKINWFKRINNGGTGRGRTRVAARKKDDSKDDKDDGKGKKGKDKKDKEKKKPKTGKVHPVLGFIGRLLMTIRNASVTYQQNDGMLLPGYKEETRILGFNSAFKAPGFGFAFGQQNRDIWGRETGRNFATTAADKGWLVENSLLNTQHVINHSQTINGKVTLEPFKDFRINVTLDRNFTENTTEYFRWNDVSQVHESQSRIQTGMLSFSTMTIATAFENYKDSYDSKAFNALLENRSEVSKILGERNPNSAAGANYYTGYGANQQEVLIGAFLTAYTGRNPNERNTNPFRSFPLPNWSANYSGLTKYQWARKFLRSFSLKHAYSSNVNMAGIQTNLKSVLDSDGHATQFDLNENFEPGKIVQNVVIAERFGPLIGFDATWIIKTKKKKSKGKLGGKTQTKQNGLITKFEWRKDRSVSLGLTNNQVTEVRGNEFIIGAGYKFPSVKLPWKLRGKTVVSDLNLRADVTIRDNVTIVRKIDDNSSQATSGQNVISIKASVDYNLGKNLNLQLYYDQQITKPKVSISYPTGNLNCGLRLRINLGGL